MEVLKKCLLRYKLDLYVFRVFVIIIEKIDGVLHRTNFLEIVKIFHKRVATRIHEQNVDIKFVVQKPTYTTI